MEKNTLEPSHRQHLLLEGLNKEIIIARRNDSDLDIEMFWELVRLGYLNNFALLGGNADWRFSLTTKALDYLQSFDLRDDHKK